MRAVARIRTENSFTVRHLLIDSFVLVTVLIVRSVPLMSDFPFSVFRIIHTVVYGIEYRFKAAVITRIDLDHINQGNIHSLTSDIHPSFGSTILFLLLAGEILFTIAAAESAI